MAPFCYLLALLLTTSLTYAQTPNRPVIGIMSLPSEYDEFPPAQWSYFAASYVKFLESGGAQVVPIPYDLPKDNMTYILDRVNGVLFTGGDADLVDTPIGNALAFVVDYVVQQNKNGTYYPLWGTCMGFQTIACVMAQNYSVLTDDCVGCANVNKDNFFNSTYQSRLYSQLPDDLKVKMTDSNISYFNHGSMIHKSVYDTTPSLNTALTAITYAYDDTGVEYISSFESPTMPIYGTQYHQEKATFEWKGPINHCADSVRLQQYLSKFFVNETKKNTNTFPDQQQFFIENHPVYNLVDSSFNQIYFFPASNSTQVIDN